MKSLVVGIDAGGTSVRAQFADAVSGELIGEPLAFRASASGEPPHDISLPPQNVESVCAGITKFTRDGTPAAWERFLRTQFPNARIAVVRTTGSRSMPPFHPGAGSS
jgi:hypothetical protein